MQDVRTLSAVLLVSAVFAGRTALCADEFIWIEGERPVKKQITENTGPGSLNDTNPDEVSGGAWLCGLASEGSPDNTAEYAVDMPAEGRWRLWLRAGIGTGINWRCDGNDWTSVDAKTGVDRQLIAADGNWYWPEPAAWFDLGNLDLSPGSHTLEFILGAGESSAKMRYAGIDCFVLATGEFTPHGKYKPNEKAPDLMPFHPGETWDFDPPDDTFDAAAEFDLRSLNEEVAGEHGMVRLSEDGNSFVHGDGEPIRFWAVLGMAQSKVEMEDLKWSARFLAKRGVNIVRTFGALYPKAAGSKVTDVDEEELDRVFKHVAALKTAGIYVAISPLWPSSCNVQESWGVNGGGAQTPANANSMVFLDPAMQEGYRAWLRALYTRPNPYTGVKLADEPAVAIIQLLNEDSLLFWTFNGVRGPALDIFRTRYADFLRQKHGSLEKARAAWQDYSPDAKEIRVQPEWDKGLPPVLDLWDFTRDGRAKKGEWPGFARCAADQFEFTVRLMHQVNADVVAYLRDDLGCKQLINPGNWRTVDTALCQDAEYWSYTPGEVTGRNFYTGGYHMGVNRGWRLKEGDYYTDVSMTREPVKLPMNLRQPLGRAFIIPEILWTHPCLYQSEGPLMVAAQTALNGIDACVWSVDGLGGWDKRTWYKWSWNSPLTLGQFPAAALIYRLGLVREGQPVVVEHRAMDHLWQRKEPLVAEESGWDPNRDIGNMVLTGTVKTAVDPLALLAGPVQVVYDSDPAKTTVADLSRCIDRAGKTVRSITGEVELNYGKGVYRVNAPRAQAVAGFLAEAGTQKLADVEITCRNAYATIITVSLDGKPIRDSGKVLVQVGTTSRPRGWTVRPTGVRADGKQTDGFQVVNLGQYPWQIENTDATITVSNPRLTRTMLLDANGMATDAQVDLKIADGKATVVLPANTMYLVLTSAS